MGNDKKPAIGAALSGVLAIPAMIKPIAIKASVPKITNVIKLTHEPLTLTPNMRLATANTISACNPLSMSLAVI